jgi:cell division protein FtsQ
MARREAEPEVGSSRSIFRYILYGCAAAALLVTALFLFQRTEQFLATNPRFTLAPPAEYGEDSPNLRIEGVRHASRAQIRQVFAEDFGRSIYLCPLEKRRLALLSVGWVKDATVARYWPNRAAVRIVERQPVAFVPIRSSDPEAPMRAALIDEEGVLLEARNPGEFRLPVLLGVRPEDNREMRRVRVRKMLKFTAEVGAAASQFSEIDVGVIENLKVTLPAGNRALTLIQGSGNYQLKLSNFFANYAEVRRRLPDATVLDLRVEDRITAVEGPRSD